MTPVSHAPKRPFLIAYDYGTGGLWGAMLARSESEILAKYPELAVVHDRPRWMSEEDLERIYEERVYDVDGAPWGLLDALLADRTRD